MVVDVLPSDRIDYLKIIGSMVHRDLRVGCRAGQGKAGQCSAGQGREDRTARCSAAVQFKALENSLRRLKVQRGAAISALMLVVLRSFLLFSSLPFLLTPALRSGFTAAFSLIFVSEIGDKVRRGIQRL